MNTWFLNNNHSLMVEGLTNLDGEKVENAEVTVQIRDKRGQLLDDVVAEPRLPGDYKANLSGDLGVREGEQLCIVVRAEWGEAVAEWEEQVTIRRRRF